MNFFSKTKKLKITADGSIVALANVQQYNATLNNQIDWTWKQLNDFLLNTNRDNVIIFDTGYGEEWTFEFLINKETDKSYFRKFEQSIEITDKRLYLVNWTDLTSSLQFEDTPLPSQDDCSLFIKLDNGFYRVVVKQLFDVEKSLSSTTVKKFG